MKVADGYEVLEPVVVEMAAAMDGFAPGVYVVEGAAPKAGTRLIPERIAGNFRFLNRADGDTWHEEDAEG